MRSLRYVLVDVFTDRPLTGNPLAVFTGAADLPQAARQAIAREMNLSETVFLGPGRDGAQASLHIHTPKRELPFAGHPVLGAAFVIGRSVQLDVIALATGKGVIAVALEREGAEVRFGWMAQPLPTREAFDDVQAVLQALGLTESLSPVEVYDNGVRHVFTEAKTLADLEALTPDSAALVRLGDLGVNAFWTDGERVVTRMFAPAHGVYEDAATGSAAGPLGLHLRRHDRLRIKDPICIEQGASISRPSELFVRVHGDPSRPDALEVGGSAVLIGRGELKLMI